MLKSSMIFILPQGLQGGSAFSMGLFKPPLRERPQEYTPEPHQSKYESSRLAERVSTFCSKFVTFSSSHPLQ